MDEEWLCEKLENLKIKENRISTLTEVRGRLNETLNLEAKLTERLLSSPEIYNCLDDEQNTDADSNSKPKELITDILDICMNNLSLRRNGDLYNLLHRALFHKRTCIRALALHTILKELNKQITDNNTEVGDIISMELLQHILLSLEDQETQIGHAASKILCIVLEKYLNEPNVKRTLMEGLKKNDVVQCRLYDLAVELANRSPANLEKVEFILDHALSKLGNDDILLQVNILEILGALAKQNPGISYLEKRKVFQVLGKRIKELQSHPLDRLLIPSMLKFLCIQPQKILNEYPYIIRFLFECLEAGDYDMFPTVFDTFVNLTQTEQCVVLLESNYTTVMQDVFKTYSYLLKSLPTDLKIRALESLKCLFSYEDKGFPGLGHILQRWFNYLSNDTNNMQFLMEFCRCPFPDIKLHALNFIWTICLYPWGIEALKNTAGFLEYLLDRDTEFNDKAKYTKFCIINLLANSEAFDVQTNIQLTQYVNQGPYFVPVITEIAIEGNQ